ncbi:MAG TPA: ComF family protein [Chthonomonadaceae bacterium]|nr:ComF family protein [Chthonomonadaceae bacterium]
MAQIEAVQAIWNGLLDLVYPPRCLVCGAWQEEPLCPACRHAIQPPDPPFCDRCGVLIAADKSLCPACELGPEPPFAWCQAMGRYEGVLRQAIHRLKYDGKTALAQPLGKLLAASLERPGSRLLPHPNASDQPAFDRVVPVPLHPSRLRERGFNQSERIARIVAQEYGWRLDTRGLRRIRRTKTQTRLGHRERAQNVQGAFAVRTSDYFAGQSVLIIDDVLTTGATVKECAQVVKDAGAVRVCITALAQDI